MQLPIERAHAIVIKPFLFFAPTSIVIALLIHNDLGAPVTFSSLFTEAISYGVMVFTLVLLKLLLNQAPRIPINAGLIFGCGTIAGASKILVFAGLTTWPPDFSDLSSAIVTVGTVCVGLAVISTEFHRIEHLRDERIKKLVETKVRLEIERETAQALLVAQANRSKEILQPVFTAALNKISAGESDEIAITKALEDLSIQTHSHLEDLAKRARTAASIQFPDLNFRTLIRNAELFSSGPGYFAAFFNSIFSASYVINAHPDSFPALRLLIVGLSTWIGFELLRLNFAKKYRNYRPFFVTGISALPFAASSIIFSDSFTSAAIPFVVYAVWLNVLDVAIRYIVGFRQNRSKIETELIREVTESEIQESFAVALNAQLLSELATYIHGNLQSRTMAASFEIREGARNADTKQFSRGINLLTALAGDPFAQLSEGSAPELSETFTRLAANWNGLMHIAFQVLASYQPKIHIDQIVAKVTEEALLNAYRHGQARQVSVQVDQIGTEITVTVVDDGIGPRNGTPGLGSRLFDSLTDNWQLIENRDGVGSLLNLKISQIN